MKDSEFKKLSRAQLIEIIYQLQLKQEELMAENERLSKALEDRRIRINKTGNMAEASLEIHNVMKAAQDAADHYLEEVKIRVNLERKKILQAAQLEADAILAYAKQKVAIEKNDNAEPEVNDEYDVTLLEIIEKIKNKNR